MTPELRQARQNLKHCQSALHRSRVGGSDRFIAERERHVLQALDYVWKAQCRAVLTMETLGYDDPATVRFVNSVDWDASGPAINHSDSLLGTVNVVTLKHAIPLPFA